MTFHKGATSPSKHCNVMLVTNFVCVANPFACRTAQDVTEDPALQLTSFTRLTCLDMSPLTRPPTSAALQCLSALQSLRRLGYFCEPALSADVAQPLSHLSALTNLAMGDVAAQVGRAYLAVTEAMPTCIAPFYACMASKTAPLAVGVGQRHSHAVSTAAAGGHVRCEKCGADGLHVHIPAAAAHSQKPPAGWAGQQAV